jgi:rhodanese-related sulfurtransferase
MRRTLQRTLIIVTGGALLGLAFNVVNPRRIPYRTPPKQAVPAADIISLSAAKELWDSGAAFFLDARAPADYAAGHIGNSFNLPAEAFVDRFPEVATMLTPDSQIVVYCDGEQCELSHHLAKLLRERGFTNVRILVNGWTVWHKTGYPTGKGAQP